MQPGSADDDLQRKRRIADKLLVDFIEIECELQGTPYLKVEVVSGPAGRYELMVGRRRLFKGKVAA